MYLTCLIRVMFVGAMKFGKAVTIEPDNAATLVTRRPTSRRSLANITTLEARRSKRETSERRDKPDTGVGREVDVTVHLNRYVT